MGFVAGEPVQPVAVRLPADYGWVHSIGGHVFDMFTHWFTCLEVIFLPAYVPNDEERGNPKLYADNVHKALACALGLAEERCSTVIGPKELKEIAAASN